MGNKVTGEGHKGHALTEFFYSGKVKGTGEFWVAFVVERSMKRNVLDFRQLMRVCVLYR
jgi:hypothetical protein